MEPSGELAQRLLSLLRDAGLPVAVIAAIGTAIALWQYSTSLSETAFATERRVLRAFASSSRRVRAQALFVTSHAVATTTTIAVTTQLLGDPRVTDVIGLSKDEALLRVQAAIAAYFLVIDWWSLTRGGALPQAAGLLVGVVGGLLVATFGIREAVEGEDWILLLPWAAAAFLWYRSFGWASSTGSGLARAIQGA